MRASNTCHRASAGPTRPRAAAKSTSNAAPAHLACTGISRAGHQLCVRHVFLSGALGKRMGLSIASAKNEQGQRAYRLEK